MSIFDPKSITFVLQQYRSKYSPYPEDYHFCLRFIEHPYKQVLKMLEEKSWYFTLRPALETGFVTSSQLKPIDKLNKLDDVAEVVLKLNLHGIGIDLLLVEDDESHLEKIVDMNTKKILFEQNQVYTDKKKG